jgi:hypothetical protein
LKIEPGRAILFVGTLPFPSSHEQNVETKMDAYIATKVKDPKSAMAAVMNMTLRHTADVLSTFMMIIAEKYEIDLDEMMETVRTDERFTGLPVDLRLHELTRGAGEPSEVPLVNPLAVAAPAAPPAAAVKKRGPKKLTEMTAEERAAHDAKTAERKAAKAAAPAPAPAAEPLAAPAPEPPATAPEPKVLKTFKLKPKVVAAPAPDA